jgi:hypothetical protein
LADGVEVIISEGDINTNTTTANGYFTASINAPQTTGYYNINITVDESSILIPFHVSNINSVDMYLLFSGR